MYYCLYSICGQRRQYRPLRSCSLIQHQWIPENMKYLIISVLRQTCLRNIVDPHQTPQNAERGVWSRSSQSECGVHYENTAIQMYRKFHLQKLKIFRQKKARIVLIFLFKHRLWVVVRTASSRRFLRVHNLCFWAEIRKIMNTLKPQFYYIKVGFNGIKII